MSGFTLIVQELSPPQEKYTLQVRWLTKITEIKKMISQLTGKAVRGLDLFYGTNPSRLYNDKTLRDYNIESDGYALRLVSAEHNQKFVLTPSPDITLNQDCTNMLSEVLKGLSGDCKPDSLDEGTGGVYFMRKWTSATKKICVPIAVFKPSNEEPGMPANRKGNPGNGEISMRENFKPGQGCMREVAAYIMDVDGFTGVPPTTLVNCEHEAFSYPTDIGKRKQTYPKLGSLQRYVPKMQEFQSVEFLNNFSDFEIQKIALFDMRVLNVDRNDGNIGCVLKQNGETSVYTHRRENRASSLSSIESNTQYSSADEWMDQSHSDEEKEGKPYDKYLLVPIDHGYAFPTRLIVCDYDWVWFSKPGIKRPVHPRIKEYMLGLQFDDLIENLTSQVVVSDETLYLLRLSHNLLVSGIKAGLTLYQIATLIARQNENQPSPIERTIAAAEDNAFNVIEFHRLSALARGTPSSKRTHVVAPTSSLLHMRARGTIVAPFPTDTPANLFGAGSEVQPSVGGMVDFNNIKTQRSRSGEHGHGPTVSSSDSGPIQYLNSNSSSSEMSNNFGIGFVNADSCYESDNENEDEDSITPPPRRSQSEIEAESSDYSTAYSNNIHILGVLPKGDVTSNESSPRSDLGGWSGKKHAPLGTSYGLGVGTGKETSMPLMRLNSYAGDGNYSAWSPIGVNVTIPPTPASTGTSSAHNTPVSGSGSNITRRSAIDGSIAPALAPANPNPNTNPNRHVGPCIDDSPSGARRGSLSKGQSGSDDCLVKASDSSNGSTPALSVASSVVSSPSQGREKHNGSPMGLQVGFDTSNQNSACNTTDSCIESCSNKDTFMDTGGSIYGAIKDRKCGSNSIGHSSKMIDTADVDTDGEGTSSPSEDIDLVYIAGDSSHNGPPRPSRLNTNDTDSDLARGTPLMRVASFTAFASPAMYNMDPTEKKMGKLSRNAARRLSVGTPEFLALRKDFTNDQLNFLITNICSKLDPLVQSTF